MKKWLAILLIMSMLVVFVSCGLLSNPTETPEQPQEQSADTQQPDANPQPDTNPLPDGNVTPQPTDEELYGFAGFEEGSDEARLYVMIHKKVAAIVSGEETKAEFFFENFETEAATYEFEQTVHIVVDTLWTHSPYEMFWYEEGTGYHFNVYPQSGAFDLRLRLAVSRDYKTLNQYQVDTTKLARAHQAKEYADSIAAAATGTDYEKILYFKEQICNMVHYDQESFEQMSAGSLQCGNDPWQMISVFDKDPSTNVVCAGYAKAFQYLCYQVGIECKMVSGDVAFPNGGGGSHMWNIVTLDGKNYIVDITNADAFGQNQLVLAGGTGDILTGYTDVNTGTHFRYFTKSDNAADMLAIFTEEELTICATSYSEQDPVVPQNPDDTENPTDPPQNND